MHWIILTGEYPSQPGGVSDYSRLVARGLAQAGDRVTVFAPDGDVQTPADDGVDVRRVPVLFGRSGLQQLAAELQQLDQPARLLVQYVPQAFGDKSINVGFCHWLFRRRELPVDVMFHEVAFPWRLQPLKHNLLAAAHRVMASLATRSADRVFVSVPAWQRVLPRRTKSGGTIQWLPVPANLTETPPDEALVADMRARIAPNSEDRVIGHFGTYSDPSNVLTELLPRLLQASPLLRLVLVGRNSCEFAGRLTRPHPDLARRITATGGLPAEQAAVSLAACDLLVQPYPDGISTRRGSVMAGLALGLPIVTAAGAQTEDIWQQTQAVLLANANTVNSLHAAVERLLLTPEDRKQFGRRGQALYQQRFCLAKTIRQLRSVIVGPVRTAEGPAPDVELCFQTCGPTTNYRP